jgi:CLIP-associating protein 1/2
MAHSEWIQLTSTAVDAINGIVPTLIASHSHLLYQSTLTSLIPIYLPLILPHGVDKLRVATSSLLPPLFEKLSDGKDRISKPAEEALIRFAQLILSDPSSSASSNLSSSGRGKEKESAIQIYERLLAGVLEGKNPRGKVGAMRVLVGVRVESRTLGLKALLPLLVALLEDGDGSVRDEAKSVSIFLIK